MAVEYCLILCIDYRVQEAFHDWISSHHLLGKADIIEIAGSSHDLVCPARPEDKSELLRNLDISISLHHPKNIFIFDHQDCGAYNMDNSIPSGQDVEPDKNAHKIFADKAKKILQELYPELNIQTFYITLSHKVFEL